ncbi:MAG: DUF3316 domain-containing protein [Alloprevotella sp.]|nr:DUF3316 domain-containing protein [Alloprevotella sp.]
MVYFHYIRLRLAALMIVATAMVATVHATEPDSLRTVERQWMFGIGHTNLLDTYLSMLEYKGPSLSVTHRTERPAHWGKGRVGVISHYTAQAALAQSPTEDARMYDMSVRAMGGLVRQWNPSPRWRLAAGAMAGGAMGLTYNTRNGNNPAQARFEASVDAELLAEYSFPLFKKTARLRGELQAPLLGVAFTPRFGQSYYELVSLQMRDRNVIFTQPGNAPCVRFAATLEIPLLGARLNIGFLSDVRQSKFHGIKHHCWQNQFVVGYTRHLFIRR